MRGLISTEDLSLKDITHYLEMATRLDALGLNSKGNLLRGRVLGCLFFEPSTRTRLSFETAMIRLGGSAIGFSEATNTSTAKGESFGDTVRTVEQYADILVIRHPREGTARLASELCSVPVINAGDGANQHPSQTLLDLYTIQRCMGRLEGLTFGFVGDLKYSRTIPPLIRVLRRMRDNTFILASPNDLRLADAEPGDLVTTDVREAVARADILYVSRIQKERFADLLEYEKVKGSYIIDAKLLAEAKPSMRLLHPLPRVNEIARDVDNTPHAAYFGQMRNGVAVRQAVLLDLLGVAL